MGLEGAGEPGVARKLPAQQLALPSSLSHGHTLEFYLQPTFWPSCSTIFLLNSRKMQLLLCSAPPHPQPVYKFYSRNTETTAPFGSPSYLPPHVPLLQGSLLT